MFFCGKKIVYLNCCKGDEKKRTVGFLRVSEGKEECCLEISIGKLEGWQDNRYKVMLIGRDEEVKLGEIRIVRGEGSGSWRMQIKEGALWLDRKKLEEKSLLGIMICGYEDTCIKGSFIGAEWERKTAAVVEKKEIVSVSEVHQEWVENYAENKWVQLCKIYPKVHPFGDMREYISIEPKDFIILQSAYQKLVNNSFLLHGFYNYRHIILGPCSEFGKKDSFCLGVPGTFYEREKMVAVMFGFEGFECNGAVEIGKFGYYIRLVEL